MGKDKWGWNYSENQCFWVSGVVLTYFVIYVMLSLRSFVENLWILGLSLPTGRQARE